MKTTKLQRANHQKKVSKKVKSQTNQLLIKARKNQLKFHRLRPL